METALDVVQVWKDVEDYLVHALHLTPYERALYYHLLRHSRLVGRRQLRISTSILTHQLGFSWTSTRYFLHQLARKGGLRIVKRGTFGFEIEVPLPEEIPGWHRSATATEPRDLVSPRDSKSAELRRAIYRRDGGRCFYCLRRLHLSMTSLDHVVPLSEGGQDSARNLVASCQNCNQEKTIQPAADFFRSLYRSGRLTAVELDDRLGALEALNQGPPNPEAP
jgi:hypothetical protein